MADIDIVPKRGTSWWVWLLLVVLVALIAWFVMAGGANAELLTPS